MDLSEHLSTEDQSVLPGSEVHLQNQMMCFYQKSCSWMLERLTALSLIQPSTLINSLSPAACIYAGTHTHTHTHLFAFYRSDSFTHAAAALSPALLIYLAVENIFNQMCLVVFMLYFLFFNLHSGCTLSSAFFCALLRADNHCAFTVSEPQSHFMNIF